MGKCIIWVSAIYLDHLTGLGQIRNLPQVGMKIKAVKKQNSYMNMQSIYTRTSTVSSTHGCSVLPSHQGNLRSLLNETETGRSDVFPSCAKKQDHLLRQFPLNSLKKQPQLQEQEEANLHIYIYCDSFQLCCVELLSGKLRFSYHAPLVALLECFTSERCTCFYINLKLTISSSEKSG